MLTETLYNKSLNCNKSVLSYVKESAQLQQLKEVLIAYFICWRWGIGMTLSELDAACEHLLLEQFHVEADFEVDDALEKLMDDGLIMKHQGKYYAVPIDIAVNLLSKKLTNSVEQSFS